MMAGRHRSNYARFASGFLLVLVVSWQVIEPAPIDRNLRTPSGPPNGAEPDRNRNKSQPNKRQTDLLDHSNGSKSGARSRRNEDPWFLDQAPLPLQPYRFVYNVKANNGLTEQYRREASDGKLLTGSYGYVLPDGIYRHVDYVADERGFRAFIRTSEPGTASENPADVVINSNPVPQQAGASYTTGGAQLGSVGGGLDAATNATSSWNYSSAAQVYALADNSPSTGAASGSRRPPGSIINTSLRNFSSLSDEQPSSLRSPTLANYPLKNFSTLPSVQSGPLPPLFESARASAPSVADFNPSRLQPTSWLTKSWSDPKTPNSDIGPNQLLNKFAPLGVFDLPNRSNQATFTGGLNRAGGSSEDSTRDQSLRNINQPNSPTSTVSRSHVDRVPLARTSPNLLHYDQPFVSYPRDNSRRIHYDASYVFYPESPFSTLEHAKSIAKLDSFDTATHGLGFKRTPDSRYSAGLFSANDIRQPTQATALSSGSTLAAHSEQHDELHSSRQSVDSTGKLMVTKERKSGNSVAVGHGGEQVSLAPQAALRADQISEPAKFQSTLSRSVNQAQPSVSSGIKSQSKGRLMAPYAGNLEQQQQQQHEQERQLDDEMPGVKGGQPPRQSENQRAQKSLTIEPIAMAPHEEPRGGRSQSDKEIGGSGDANRSGGAGTKVKERHSDEFAPKSKTTLEGASEHSKSTQKRTVRVPEEHLSRVLVDHVRSGQNSMGLGETAHFQRSSSPSSGEPVFTTSRVQSTDGLVQMHPNPIHKNAPAREAEKLEIGEPKSSQPDEEPRRALRSGRLDRSTISEELAQWTGREAFEALRLSADKAQVLRLDKLSELEKFQRRLRSQQKLLESIKSPIETASKQSAAPSSRTSSGSDNSHVSYDEPNDHDTQNKLKLTIHDRDRTVATFKSLPVGEKLLHIRELDLSGRSGGKETPQNRVVGEEKVGGTEARSPNTINLDFINSATALSVDHSNPFAIPSVDPAVQRSSERLSPHRISLPVVGNSTGFAGGHSLVAASTARIFGPPNSASSFERHTSSSLGSALRIDATGSASLVSSNHQSALSDPTQVGSMHFLHESANSPHKSFMPTPLGSRPEVRNLDTNRDGFEIRDQPIQVDDQKFFEVVAN